jgi:hypothetical protein
MRYVLGFLTVLAVILLSVEVMQRVGDRVCETETAEFKSRLTGAVSMVQNVPGRYNTERFKMPCDSDKAYFFELDKPVPVDSYNHSGIMFHGIKSHSPNNIYLFRGEELRAAIPMEGFRIGYPHYLCFDTQQDRLFLGVEGRLNGVTLRHVSEKVDTVYDCTNYSIEHIFLELPQEDEVERFGGQMEKDQDLAEFIDVDPLEMKSLTEKTDPFVLILRSVKYQRNRNKTKVKIHIVSHGNKLRDFTYLEEILKDCIELLSQEGFAVVTDEADASMQREDPMLVWKFDELRKGYGKNIHYEVDGDRVDCLSYVNAFGFAVGVEEEEED